jgi:hypothetical protein
MLRAVVEDAATGAIEGSPEDMTAAESEGRTMNREYATPTLRRRTDDVTLRPIRPAARDYNVNQAI